MPMDWAFRLRGRAGRERPRRSCAGTAAAARRVGACVLLAVAGIPLPASSQTPARDADTLRIPAEVLARALQATVLIRTDEGIGAGFFVATNGYLLTNYHVIEGASKAVVETQDGRKFAVQHVCGYSPKTDVAMLKVQAASPQCLTLSDPSSVALDDPVFLIGHPHGHSWTLSKGYIAGKRKEGDRPIIQFSADMSPGNSGGPVVRYDGTVCGMATYLEQRTLRFSDGKYALDPSSVLKFGIAVDAFRSATNSPESQRTFSMAEVAALSNRPRALRLMVPILDITSDRLMALREGLAELRFDTNYAYNPRHRELGSQGAGGRTRVRNYDDFIDAALRLHAASAFLKELVPGATGDRSIDAAIDKWRESIEAAAKVVSHIAESDGAQGALASAQVAKAKKQFNAAIAALRASLSNAETALKAYDGYIHDHIIPPSRITELRQQYERTKAEL